MVSDKKKSKLTNVALSIEHIKRYFKALPFDRLPSDAKTENLKKKKEYAETALAYLDYFSKRKVLEVQTLSPCGPKPYIPELP